MLKPFGRMVLPDFTFFRCLVLAFGLAPVTGCYTYAPLTSEPVPGMNLRLTSMGTPQQLTLVSPGDPVRVGGLREVNGSVVANERGELRLRVDAIEFAKADAHFRDVDREFGRGSIAAIPASQRQGANSPFATSERRVSAGRTALLAGGLALVGIGAIYVALIHTAEQTLIKTIFTPTSWH